VTNIFIVVAAVCCATAVVAGIVGPADSITRETQGLMLLTAAFSAALWVHSRRSP
jgi:hypothetical protein